jgi:hypothetical protein
LKNYEKKISITSYGPKRLKFSNLVAFEKLLNGGITKYYVCDFDTNQLLIFDDNWEFIETKPFFKSVSSMKKIGDNILVTINTQSKTYLQILDNNLNILQNLSTGLMSSYLDFWYDESNRLIYIPSHNRQRIDIYDQNLVLLKNLSVPGYYIKSINGYKNVLYAGTLTGEILVIENDRIKKFLKVCNNLYAYSIQFDSMGLMAVNCYYEKSIKLFTINGLNMNWNKNTIESSNYFDIDSKGRMIILTSREISIYY